MRRKKLWFAIPFAFGLLVLSACGGSNNSTLSPEDKAAIQQGELIFQANCSACHSTTIDTIIVGPPLIGIASRAGDTVQGLDAREYIRQSILEPGVYVREGFDDLMPKNFSVILSTDDIDAVVSYLMTLK